MDTPVFHLPSRETRKCLFKSPDQENESPHTVLYSTTPLGIAQKRNRQISWSPRKRTPVKSPPKKKTRKGAWSHAELCSLVEFVALHKDIQSMQSSDSEWPAMNADNNYWMEASDFINMSCGTSRGSVACRAKVVNFLRKAFPTIVDAEEEFAINYENKCHNDSGIQKIPPTPASAFSLEKFQHCYLSKFTQEEAISLWKRLGKDIPAHVLLQSVQENIPEDELVKITSNASFKCLEEFISRSFSRLTLDRQKNCLNKLFITAAKRESVTHVETFPSLAMEAMKMLKEKGKSNVLRDFARCLGLKRPESNEPLMPVDRMPFGLIQHQIQFFCASDVRQISIPEDYYQWLETLDAEFDDRLGRVLRGPMWSGQSSDCVGDPLKARVNLAAVSKSTINRRTASSDFTDTPSIQTPAINVLKETNPGGRYWIKLDGTDVKEGLQHSMKEKWDGDVDMLDGQLSKLQEEYRWRLKSVALSDYTDCAIPREELLCDLNCDKTFLEKLFTEASRNLRSKISQKNTSAETLKTLNWDVVECNTLLQQCQGFVDQFNNAEDIPALLKCLTDDLHLYFKNLYKKKRTAATHVLVITVSDEQRRSKPYTLPVQFIPYKSLRDQFIRDLTLPLKRAMKDAGLEVVGTVTDGEFNSLRTQGESGPLHIWQLVHDAKEAVRKMSKTTLQSMLTYAGEGANGIPFSTTPNSAIPTDLIGKLHELQNGGLSFEDAIANIRGSLVPEGYTPYPFRKDTPESFLDKMRSIVATFIYKDAIKTLKQEGRDFTQHLYVPEKDSVTGKDHHERGDHNHILKRIAGCTRECRYQELNPEAFDKAMLDPLTGLSHAALTGQRPQSVEDAERLLSYHVAASMQKQDFNLEAEYVQTIAAWHEASDGRGMSQLDRCKANHEMLNYLLDQLMPWHKEIYDFSTLDINRPMDTIRGFTRETFIEITTNIESQEYRRRQNNILGYPEHPRAATTDDVECFFSLTRRHLGDTFTVKEFRTGWRKLVREFSKRIDPDLRFHYWTLNERFHVEQSQFDENAGDKRLHIVKHKSREDSSIFTAGRAFLPAKNKQSIRQRLFRVDVGLPPVPNAVRPC